MLSYRVAAFFLAEDIIRSQEHFHRDQSCRRFRKWASSMAAIAQEPPERAFSGEVASSTRRPRCIHATAGSPNVPLLHVNNTSRWLSEAGVTINHRIPPSPVGRNHVKFSVFMDLGGTLDCPLGPSVGARSLGTIRAHIECGSKNEWVIECLPI